MFCTSRMHIELAKMKRMAYMLLILITFFSRSMTCFILGQSTSPTNISASESFASVTTNIITYTAALVKDIVDGISKFLLKVRISIEVTKDCPEVTFANKSTIYEAAITAPIVPEVTAASVNHFDREKPLSSTNTTATTANNKAKYCFILLIFTTGYINWPLWKREKEASHYNGTLISDEPSELYKLYLRTLDWDQYIEASPEVVAYFARLFKDMASAQLYVTDPYPIRPTTLIIDQFFKKADTPRMKIEYELVYPVNETYFGYKEVSREPQ